ncbi:sugar kinase [Streptomyces sp. CA-288835]|uniref:sugar kinase n=1 Tax=Streptomyces sp. CA-288835 TaxID=3240069 RepID=UPI003D9085B6
MTTTSLPNQTPSPDEPRPSEGRGHMIRRRALTLLIIVLLIGIPAGYLVISANQSRDSGRTKEEKYAARGLTHEWPSRVQRRLYNVPIPPGSKEVAYYETNNWRTSRLYVQFLTSNDGLDTFLKNVGTSRAALEKDDFPISARHRNIVDWDFTTPGPWSGLTRARKNPTPTLDMVVNWSRPGHPMVYVVARTTP